MFFDTERNVWTVSGLTEAIKGQLQNAFPMVKVEGEISNCRPSGAGHLYFTLKDANAVIAAALFRGRAGRVAVIPADGMKVVLTGRIDVYPPRGSYQLIVENIIHAGRGALLEALEKRKQRLAAEGLFDVDRKRALPPYPRQVVLVTSPTGAAVRDILQVLARRAAAPHVIVLPTLVQGDGAAESIADQIARANSYNLGDVIIVSRGGGSIEDLMAFNEEKSVRAIANSQLPVISGVGHEIDITLADLAADVRAATPSAAAELVSDRSEDLLLRTRGFRQTAMDLLAVRTSEARRHLQRYDTKGLLVIARGRLDPLMRQSDEARRLFQDNTVQRLELLRQGLNMAVQTIWNASPQAVLARGYARVLKDGTGVDSAALLSPGDGIEILFSDGKVGAEVTVNNTD